MNQSSYQEGGGILYYDEAQDLPYIFLPDGKVKAIRWWWPPDRKKAKLLTTILNSDTFKKDMLEYSWYSYSAPPKKANK